MAKPKATGRKPKTTAKPAAAPNLFARAKASTKDAPKKKKGTTIMLPRDLDDDGQLKGESKVLNEAITIAIAAKREVDAAKGRLSASMNNLKDWTVESWCEKFALGGVQPTTPVVIQNHKGETLSFVVQDKSQQNAINEEQIELLGLVLGEEVANDHVEHRDTYGFSPDTMKETAQGGKADGTESVQDVVFEIVSEAVLGNVKLSDDQKATLITTVSKTYLRKNTLARLAELCGSNVGKVRSVVQAAGSAFVHYLKP